MTFAASLLAFALAQQGTAKPTIPAAPQSGLVVEGKPVDLVFPSAQSEVDQGILKWKGLAYLGGAPGKLSERYFAGYDWSPIQKPPAYKADAVTWRMRVFIFAATQRTAKGSFGFDRSARYTFTEARLQEAEQSLARLVPWVSVFTDGQVRLVPEITVEREIVPGVEISPEFTRTFFGPRINGGGYEAEDKVFRGPYQSALYIVPGPQQTKLEPTTVYGTPVVGIAENPNGERYAPGQFDSSMRSAFIRQASARLVASGYALANDDVQLPVAGSWAKAADTSSVPTEALLDRLKNRKEVRLGLSRPPFLTLGSAKSSCTTVSLFGDSDRGDVLRYVENDAARNGAFMLPVRADGKPLANLNETPTLSFWISTKTTDPIGLTLYGPANKQAHVSLGRSDIAGLCNPPEASLAFSADGTWKHVLVDAKSVAQRAGFSDVEGIAIEGTPGALLNGRLALGEIVADFDDFRFTSDPPQEFLPDPKPDAASTSEEDRALFAAQASATSPALIALLVDPSPLVRLNAATAYTRIKDNQAQPNLVKCVVDIDPWVASAGLRALMNQGGDIAIVTTQRMVKIGATALVRATAGELLGATKDPKYRQDIAALLIDRSWQNRLAAVRALSELPGNESAIVRMAFLDQTEPEIKLAATRSVDPSDEFEERKLLWSAVNEPGDMIRAESDIKLIQSPNETFRTEGYKGVRDDSRTTRILLLTYMAEHPAESHRNALRLAVTDRSPEVRAAALRAFAALEKGAQSDEIANVLEDPDPRVQLALQEFSKKRGFALPPKTRELMSASPDAAVRNGLAGLP